VRVENGTIVSERLELVPMTAEFVEAALAGGTAETSRIVGAVVPAGWPSDAEHGFLRYRLEQMRRDPALLPWLVRALVLRDGRGFVGHAGFHGGPGTNGKSVPDAVELGYQVLAEHRGRGLATEAASALIGWARQEHGVRRFIVSIAPGNEPSLAIARKLGFVQTGEQWDDVDGLELVFELVRQ
jgi:RimJ/RimL family protein N-acetyltransferase